MQVEFKPWFTIYCKTNFLVFLFCKCSVYKNNAEISITGFYKNIKQNCLKTLDKDLTKSKYSSVYCIIAYILPS